jgi:tartrate dehydrogenase/decarboxylase/D-malate dehydrogenase|nr:tartrate dehydrogenase [Candidatus Krumholzibacteria bacterium]
MPSYFLKTIPGDGIGTEVMVTARQVLDRLALLHGQLTFRYEELPWSCAWSLENGAMMPADGLTRLADCDAILLGAVGYPGVPDHVSLRGLLLPIRMGFEQYVNLRPVKLLPGLKSPLRVDDPAKIDFVVLRENTEGEYCGAGRLENPGTPQETAVQEARFSRKGTERIIRYAFEYAAAHGRSRVLSATKSNALNHSMVFWDRVFTEVAAEFPGTAAASMHVDALAGQFLLRPEALDVVVASNLFGDILTDLGSAMLGSIGISPSANLNPTGQFPSMFEPVHGSAPDIAGRGLANPTGMIWTVALMLEHLGEVDCADRLMSALTAVLSAGEFLTPDLGGHHSTSEMTDAVLAELSL